MGVFGRCLLRVLPAMLAAAMGLLIPAPFVHAEEDEWAMEFPEPGPETPLSSEEQENALAVIREMLTVREKRVASFDLTWRERKAVGPLPLPDAASTTQSSITGAPEHLSRFVLDGDRSRLDYLAVDGSTGGRFLDAVEAFDGTHLRNLRIPQDGAAPVAEEGDRPTDIWGAPLLVLGINLRLSQVEESMIAPFTADNWRVSHGQVEDAPCYVLRRADLPGRPPRDDAIWIDRESFVVRLDLRKNLHDDGTVEPVVSAWSHYGRQIDDGVPDRWRDVIYSAGGVLVRDYRCVLKSSVINSPPRPGTFAPDYPPGTVVTVWKEGVIRPEVFTVGDDGRRNRRSDILAAPAAPKAPVRVGAWMGLLGALVALAVLMLWWIRRS